VEYDVQVYAVYMLTVQSVEADSPAEACRKAYDQADYRQYEDHNFQWAEEVYEFVVDSDNDPEYPVWLPAQQVWPEDYIEENQPKRGEPA
jgi:hypothetical protein